MTLGLEGRCSIQLSYQGREEGVGPNHWSKVLTKSDALGNQPHGQHSYVISPTNFHPLSVRSHGARFHHPSSGGKPVDHIRHSDSL